MFGLSFGELMVLLVVAVVVLGPKELPRYLRKAGQLAGQLRRMAFEMREKSGIDEVLRTEGIDRDLAEIRRLARGELTGVVSAVRSTTDAMRFDFPKTPAVTPFSKTEAVEALAPTPEAATPEGAGGESAAGSAAATASESAAESATAPATESAPAPEPALAQAPAPPPAPVAPLVVDRQREYPSDGVDAYGALPDTATLPDELPASPLADDALYARGEAA